MPAYFEISFLTENNANSKFLEELGLKFGHHNYLGKLKFFHNLNIVFSEFNLIDIIEYEISVENSNLFSRTNLIDKIKILLSDLVEVNKLIPFNYAIANIETNSLFISENNRIKLPSKEMMLKSTLVFLSKNDLKKVKINFFHFIFIEEEMVCLYNPISGTLFCLDEMNKYDCTDPL